MVQSFGEHSPISNLCKQSQVDHKSYCNNIRCAPRNWPSHRHHRLLVAVSYRPGNSVIFDIWKTSNTSGILAKNPWKTLGPRLSMNGAETAHLRASRRSKTRVIHVVQTANDGYAGDFRGSRHDQLDRHFLSTDILRCTFRWSWEACCKFNDTWGRRGNTYQWVCFPVLIAPTRLWTVVRM